MEPGSPDAGMQLLSQQYAAQAAQAAAPPDGPLGPGAELDVFARLAVAIDEASAEMRRQRQAARKAWEHCHPIQLFPLTNNAAGILSDPERWGPRSSWAWQVLRVSVVSNATGGATAADLFIDSAAMEGATQLNHFSGTAGAFMGVWEPKGKFLLPGQQLVWQSTGGGITVSGEAIEIALDWLPTYLM